MIYGLLAPYYDKFNRDIDYTAWADFIENASLRYGCVRPELILDLGCGTGKMALELARRGYDMTGVDYSFDMLNIARQTAEDEGFQDKILWLCQDITEFELYGTVDLTVCCLDTLNHLTKRAELDRCLSLVHNYLVPDGLFIFDVNGKVKFENVYSNNSYVFEDGTDFCIWQNAYDKKSRLCDFYITVFREEQDGKYERFDEVQTERMYTLRALKDALRSAGFEYIGAFSDFNFTPASDLDDRIYIVAKSKKDV